MFNVFGVEKSPLLDISISKNVKSEVAIWDEDILLSLSRLGMTDNLTKMMVLFYNQEQDKSKTGSQWNAISQFFKHSLCKKSQHRGNTPLHNAVLSEDKDVVAFFLWWCVVLDIQIDALRNNENETPMDLLKTVTSNVEQLQCGKQLKKQRISNCEYMHNLFECAQAKDEKVLRTVVRRFFLVHDIEHSGFN